MLNDKTGTQWAVEIQEIQPSFFNKKILQGQKEGGGGGGQRFSRETESIVQIDRHTDLEKSELL